MTEISCLAKYSSTHAAEESLLSLRSLLGMRALQNAYISAALKEVMFGPVHPTTDFDIEQYFIEELNNGRARAHTTPQLL
jgi:hypothetical protein